MTHTPGPWQLAPDRDREGAFHIDVDGYAVALVYLRGSSPASPQYHQQDANARLIAAAPELLDALKSAVRTIRTWHGLGMTGGAEQQLWELYQASPEMQRINDAIAKAEGR